MQRWAACPSGTPPLPSSRLSEQCSVLSPCGNLQENTEVTFIISILLLLRSASAAPPATMMLMLDIACIVSIVFYTLALCEAPTNGFAYPHCLTLLRCKCQSSTCKKLSRPEAGVEPSGPRQHRGTQLRDLPKKDRLMRLSGLDVLGWSGCCGLSQSEVSHLPQFWRRWLAVARHLCCGKELEPKRNPTSWKVFSTSAFVVRRIEDLVHLPYINQCYAPSPSEDTYPFRRNHQCPVRPVQKMHLVRRRDNFAAFWG